MGLHLLGVIPMPQLGRTYRLTVAGSGSIASSIAIGAAFAAGWTPCVGPILGAILTLAAGRDHPLAAATLLAAYAGGLAVPFLVAAVAFGSAPGVIRRLNRRLGVVCGVSGAIVLALGLILLLGLFEHLFAELAGLAPWLPWEPKV